MKTDEPHSTSAQSAFTQAAANAAAARAALQSITLTWSDWSNSPIYFTQCKITFYENGDWEASCNAEDRSGHSDWDVTVTYSLISTATGAEIAELGSWFQDLDHGENYNKSAIGNNSNIRDGFRFIRDGSYGANMHSHIVRDN